MTAVPEDPLVETINPSQKNLVDPEADAEDALKTLRQFVLQDVTPDAPPIDKWHGLDACIEELCSFGIDRLTREPDDLNAACHRLKNELEDVACGNYRALIESFECAGAVRQGVAGVRSRLDDLVQALPKLADTTRQFSIKVVDKQVERENRLRSIAELNAVEDILEMPRLMRTLIAAELYDEALELRDNSLKLLILHPEERLIRAVCGEMHILTQQMVLQLLVLLRNSVQLPMCLRVIGFLRRLAVFSEFKLRMLFLQCRGEWMRAGIESSSASTQQAELVNLSDNTRSMVFEIVTQYRAVFSDITDDDDDDALLPDYPNGGSPLNNAHSAAILFDWTLSCVSSYLQKLEAGIKHIADGGALNTVLLQAMYCGQSLGRVGADFRARLPPIFEEAALRIYKSHLNAALRQFEMMIEDNRWAPVGSSALRKERGQPLTGVAGDRKDETKDGGKTAVEDEDGFGPPAGVLDSPPLAVFLNGILVALNDLRLCAPISLSRRVGGSLQRTLIKAGEYMSAIGGPGGAFLKRADRPHFIAMSASLRDLCVRHAARCLDHCMGRQGLVDIEAVEAALTDIFGESLAPASLATQESELLNGTGGGAEIDDSNFKPQDAEGEASEMQGTKRDGQDGSAYASENKGDDHVIL